MIIIIGGKKSMFDKINPVFNISEENKRTIIKIDNLLHNIKITEDKKIKYLKTKSKVRSVHSSLAIEDNSLTLEDVTNIVENKLIVGKKDEIQEVKNAIELYNNINNYNWKHEDDFLKAHVKLMKYFDDDEGHYRNYGEGIKKGDSIIFTAPQSILVPSLMKSLFDFINEKEKEINLLILAAIFHYYVVYIHPFSDGNGRMARFWVTLILKSYNENLEFIPLEEEMYINREDYYNSISSCHNNGNANEFINFMLKTILNCIKKTTQKTTQKKLNKNQIKILNLIKENPNITRNELSKKLNITPDGIKYNIKKLKESNIIERIGPDNGGYWKIN